MARLVDESDDRAGRGQLVMHFVVGVIIQGIQVVFGPLIFLQK